MSKTLTSLHRKIINREKIGRGLTNHLPFVKSVRLFHLQSFVLYGSKLNTGLLLIAHCNYVHSYICVLDRCFNIAGQAFVKYDDIYSVVYMPRSCCVSSKVMIYSTPSLSQCSLYDEAQMTCFLHS